MYMYYIYIHALCTYNMHKAAALYVYIYYMHKQAAQCVLYVFGATLYCIYICIKPERVKKFSLLFPSFASAGEFNTRKQKCSSNVYSKGDIMYYMTECGGTLLLPLPAYKRNV